MPFNKHIVTSEVGSANASHRHEDKIAKGSWFYICAYLVFLSLGITLMKREDYDIAAGLANQALTTKNYRAEY